MFWLYVSDPKDPNEFQRMKLYNVTPHATLEDATSEALALDEVYDEVVVVETGAGRPWELFVRKDKP